MRHFSSLTCVRLPCGIAPALLTRTSTSAHFCPSAAALPGAAMSTTCTVTFTLCFLPMSSAAASIAAADRAAKCTFAPSAAKPRAHARPMPFDAPVISTLLATQLEIHAALSRSKIRCGIIAEDTSGICCAEILSHCAIYPGDCRCAVHAVSRGSATTLSSRNRSALIAITSAGRRD